MILTLLTVISLLSRYAAMSQLIADWINISISFLFSSNMAMVIALLYIILITLKKFISHMVIMNFLLVTKTGLCILILLLIVKFQALGFILIMLLSAGM